MNLICLYSAYMEDIYLPHTQRLDSVHEMLWVAFIEKNVSIYILHISEGLLVSQHVDTHANERRALNPQTI